MFFAIVNTPLFPFQTFCLPYPLSPPVRLSSISATLQKCPRHCTTPDLTSPHAATMPLAERDVNTQRQRPLTRGKRLHAAGSVTDENSAPALTIGRAHETPTRQQRFFTPTKASAAKNTPSPATIQPRAQPQSGRNTPLSQKQSLKLPRRNVATSAARPAYDPPISKWNLSAATNSRPRADASALPTSPSPLSPRETARDRSLVRSNTRSIAQIVLTSHIDRPRGFDLLAAWCSS